ncbi:isoprenylcysteine carboxylmethyltransferase family protein [Shewanella mesophila]|uniref:methyltransferase family protein n=1 Tax=Shewanella mesophila TaxID=2864208 RepID=UPI001C658265|nr:isoprenylcysteine carboxylmethyltransferase family protein [Shewanella mesophila]QYJ87189.1 isoprenylcysteine carboxylmethyltransferase family protein [Shewanella mesophila]
MAEIDRKGAQVKFPPPLIFVSFMALAYWMGSFYPITFSSPEWLKFIAAFLMVMGFAILLHILFIFKRQQTAIEPWQPTSVIISHGYYRYSRNPIYLIFCLYPIGLGCMLGSLWLIVSLVPACIAVYLIAIKAEERYLHQKFPQEYGEYCLRVRRWL